MLRTFIIILTTVLLMLIPGLNYAHAQNKQSQKNDAEPQGRLVESIEIEGNNHISDASVKQSMYTKKSRWWNKHRFDVTVFNEDMRSIIALYNNRGYLDAKVSWDSTHVQTDRVLLTVDVIEGPQSFIRQVLFENNQVFPDSRLRDEVKVREGQPFSYVKVTESTWSVVNLYAAEGYLDAQVNPEISIEGRDIDVIFQLQEGNAIYADSIEIQGNEKTNIAVIRREIKIESGELITNEKLAASQKNLYRTGLFNSVTLTPVQDSAGSAGTRDVEIMLVESETGELNLGLGYGSEENIRVTAEILQGNFLGTGQRIGFRNRAGFRNYDLSLREARSEFLFTAPYFLLASVQLDNSTYFQREIEKNYILNRIGTQLTFGRDIWLHSRIFSTTKIENNYFSRFDTASVLDTSNARIRSVDFNFSRDTRDNLFDPRYGSYMKVSTLVAGQFLSGTNSFVRFTADYRRYRTLTQRLSLAGNAYFGFLFETAGARGTPIYERFYAGGDGSIRGYRDRVIGPKLNGDPIGGNFKFVLRGEARLGIIKNLHTAIFLDIGNVWTDISAENLLNIKSGTGLGLRYKTPLGVVRLDYGFKIDKINNIDYGRFHFSIGQAL